MPVENPYAEDLGNRAPLEALADTPERIRRLVEPWSAETFEKSYAPGKWTARQILAHLAHTEMALGVRARMALTTPAYVAQPFDQDAWVARETRVSGPEAVAAWLALSRLNAALFEGLSAADRRTAMTHPEYGTITVEHARARTCTEPLFKKLPFDKPSAPVTAKLDVHFAK